MPQPGVSSAHPSLLYNDLDKVNLFLVGYAYFDHIFHGQISGTF